jgi:eukaryotic-like serine/threonine-protein kinase
MPAPIITLQQAMGALSDDATDIQPVGSGGQKVVFSGIIAGKRYALKFLSPQGQNAPDESETDTLDVVAARARREVGTMQECDSPYMVKPGPIAMKTVTIGEERYLFFTEEWIEGADLKTLLSQNRPLGVEDIYRLGEHITRAIDCLWSYAKIHRDIKPGNIMRRASDGTFILLDMGLVFDLNDASLSQTPVGTPIYFSPEQLDFANRRSILDFRSDLFSLGIVLYEMSTKHHPFLTADVRNTWDVFRNIQTYTPQEPIRLRPDLPPQMNDIIMRLLAKRPALRFRRCAMLLDALRQGSGRGSL